MNRLKPLLFLALLPACQPPRSPVVRPLEMGGKPQPKLEEVEAPARDLVRIGIRVDVSEASVNSTDAIEAINLIDNTKQTWPPGRHLFRAQNGNLFLDDNPIGKKWRLQSGDPGKHLQTADKEYRGNFVIRVTNDDKVTIVNELSIDDYLKGVLPREVSASWADQALRVQAVASRTYMASHLNAHAKQGFDLCSDVHCQVYGGMTKEHPKTNDAVDATRDQILIYDGKPIGAFFHANCGGSTEEIGAVWGQTNRPYLPRKKCTYGNDNPRQHWSLTLNNKDILAALKKGTDVKGDKLLTLRIKKKSGSGRTQTVTVKTDSGTWDLSGNGFRIALHPEKIRSTLWTDFFRHGDGYTFEGLGWGHGVGMCQWGAKGQAERGKDYRDILQFYYPHTDLVKWSR